MLLTVHDPSKPKLDAARLTEGKITSFSGIRMPTLKHSFVLKQWLSLSKAKEDLLASQLISVNISIQKPSYGSRPIGVGSVNTAIFVIEDDRDGLVSNIITQDFPMSMQVPLIRIGIINSGSDVTSYMNIEGVKIMDISYDLDYALSETAKYVVHCEFARMFRTID